MTRRGSCAVRKVELMGGPGWQRGERATRAWALVAGSCGASAVEWAAERGERELGLARVGLRGGRGGGGLG